MLAAHLTVSVGWIGAVAAYLSLDVAVTISDDVRTLRGAYLAMNLIASRVIVPLAVASLITGVVISLATKWGLFRYYWVLTSLLLTIIATIILLVETRVIRSFAVMAADPLTSTEHLRAMGGTLVHSVGGAAVLIVILVLNVFKPSGLTRHGWRRQQEERRRTREAIA